MPSPARDARPGAASREAGLSIDPLALFGFGPDPVVAPAQTPADDVPELRGAFIPPAVVAEPSPAPSRSAWHASAAPVPTRSEAPSDADPHELWRAFREGAGIGVDPARGPDPELMRSAGAVLRAAVEGTLQMMAVRATIKYELHAQVTMIQSRDNNPLKFSPDAGAALEQMLRPPLRGFLAGPAAMTDAMHDLVGHTIGTMAGTRAALEGVLDRFRPQALEAKLTAKSMLDSLLPMNRKAKLWELYLLQFEAIRGEAHDDFHTLFGKAFLAAYEQQLERLRRGEPGQV